MIKNNGSKFYLAEDKVEQHRDRVARKNFVLIALTSVMSIYATGIALAALV
jgi:hypothetical protein